MKKINIKGVIIFDDYKEVYNFYGIENTSVSDVVNALPTDGSPVELIINSGGGMVDAGSEIYSNLKDYGGEITAKIFSMAASAASLLAMGADKILIAPTAQIMIHNVSGGIDGDYRVMQKEASVLENYNKAIANAYMIKTGKSEEDVLDLMNKETYFTAQQSVEQGFADKVLFDVEAPKAASIKATLLPQAVVEKARQLMSQTKPTGGGITDEQIQSIVNQVTSNLKVNQAPIVADPVIVTPVIKKNNLASMFTNLN